MAAHLDTAVDGEPGSCAAAAEWMSTLADAARSAADRFGTAIATAKSGWYGPASESFQIAVHYVPADIERVAETGAKIATGLAEFGFALTAVIGKMTDLLGRARAGGLDIDGTIVLAPAPGPVLNRYLSVLASASYRNQLLNEEELAYVRSDEVRAALDDHNAKVRLYNECIDVAREIREQEQEAHRTLHDVIVPPAMELSDVMLRITRLSIVFTAGKQAYNALAGHQTWGEAAIKTPSIIAGGLAGAANGAGVGTVLLPGAGTVIGGVLGAIGGSFVGGILGSDVADFVLPEADLLEGVEDSEEIEFYSGR